MTTTPNLGLTLVEQSQAQKEITVNMAFMRMDALLNSGVIDKDLSTPPGSPSDGDVYIVASSATDDWEGQENAIAYFDQIWRFITPNEGLTIWAQDEDVHYTFDGSDWVATAGSSLAGLSDVTLTSPADGEVLIYDSVSGGWKNDTVAGGGGGGETNTASNVNGDSGGVFKSKTGVDLTFNNITAGSNITVSGGGNSGGDITITGGAGSGGDMGTGTYDPASVAEQLVGLTATQTLTNKTLTTPVLTLQQSASPAPTTEGDIQWDSDDNRIVVGDGSGQKSFSDDSVVLARGNHTGTQTMSTISDAGSLATRSTIDNADWSGDDLAVANGGTGLSSITADCVVTGNGTSAMNVTGVMVDGSDALYGFKAKINNQTGATYSLTIGDTGKVVELNNASAITLTLPDNLPVGFSCTIAQLGAGQVTFSEGGGATLQHRQSHTQTAGQYAMATLYVTSNSGGSSAVYVLAGDTE